MQGDFQLIWYNESNVPTLKQLKKLSNQRFFENKFIVLDNIGAKTKTNEFELLRINAVGASGIIFLEENKLRLIGRSLQCFWDVVCYSYRFSFINTKSY